MPEPEKHPLVRAAERQRALVAENERLRAAMERNQAEIDRITVVMETLRDYDPLRQLPGVGEPIAAPYGDLKSKTVPEACVVILRKRGEPMTARRLLEILVDAGKLSEVKTSTHISVLGALKRHPELFTRIEGKGWVLTAPQSNGHQPALELEGGGA